MLQRRTVFYGAVMIDAAEPFNRHLPLDLHANPFSAASNALRPVSPVQTALEEAVGHIGLRHRAIVIAGRPGTGKTSLLKTIFRACADTGLSVCRFDRGDLADPTIDARSDVVLVDEADSIPDSAVLALLVPNPCDAATTWVFACLPSSVHRFSCLDADIVELRGLSVEDARTYLLERATSIGRPDLFAPDALDLIVHRARGSPRLLLSMASLAFFTAAWGRATQIGVRHVAYWLKSEVVEDSAAPQGEVLRRESANQIKATHRSGYERDAYRSIGGLIGDGRAVMARLPKRAPLNRVRPSTGATAAIAASVGLAVVLAGFLVGGNDAGVRTSATAPVVPNPVVAEANPVQAPAPPVGPDIQTSAAPDAPEPASASVDAPAGKAAAASGNRNPSPARQPRAASKRTAPPAPVRTVRPARAPKSASPPAATQEASQRARDAVHVARQAEDVARRTAEAALRAQHAARQANEAARRADRAARRADQAASKAERAARLANWGIRVHLPWKATAPQRRAS